jgi:phenylalanyl-tRNA synthetase beta chain
VAPAKLANPLSEEAGVLRSTGNVTMAAAIEWNLNHSQRSVKLFEIGWRYALKGAEAVEAPVLAIGATGEVRPQGLHDAARDYSFADLKGDLDAIGALSGGIGWQDGGPDWLNAAKRGRIFLKENELGAAGLLAKRVAEKFKFRQDVFLAEIALGSLYCAYYGAKNARRYEPLPRFPAVERDFSLLLADGVRFADVTKAIQSLGIAEITSIEAADLFRGKNVPAGKYSLMVRVTLQSKAATLTDAQIGEVSGKIVASLEKNLGAQLRAS